jgi:hypothetical protein
MKNSQIKSFAVKWEDDIRKGSASGALFPAIAKYIIDQKKGYVCGCVLENMRPIHIVSNQWSDVLRMQDSKYVQSIMGGCYRRIAELLKQNSWVLFTGTSCEVDGLIKFLTLKNVNMDNLLTMDFFCHGVPSPLVWRDFLRFYEGKMHRKPIRYRFRGKKYGWRGTNHLHTVKYIKRGVEKEDNFSYIGSRMWDTIFFSNICLRPGCHQCPYTTYLKPSDMTMGDFWGIEDCLPEFDDGKGCSLLMARSIKAQSVLGQIDYLTVEDVPLDYVMKKQINAFKPSVRHKKREEFWKDYETHTFSYIAKKYFYYKLSCRVRSYMNRILFEAGLRKRA